MKIQGDIILMVAIAAFIAGIVFGEKKQCEYLKGSYSWDYGTCKID